MLCPTTFDFAGFVVCARTLGADHVHFKTAGGIQTKKFPAQRAWARYNEILLGLTGLAGMTHSKGPEEGGIAPMFHFGTVEALYKELGRIWKFPLIEGERGYITVTKRDSFRYRERNSSVHWKEFIKASKRRVVVLEEAEFNPMPFPERMKLYSNAEMNYFVNNGPMTLCTFSEAPYRIFNMAPSNEMKEHYRKTGFPEGSQFSFRNERQEILWKPDTLENLMAHIDD